MRSLSVSIGKFFFFFTFWCLWRFSAPNSIGALPSFRLGLHFSALICILRDGSHWKRSRQSMCGRCWSSARKSLSIPLKVGPDVCHYLYWYAWVNTVIYSAGIGLSFSHKFLQSLINSTQWASTTWPHVNWEHQQSCKSIKKFCSQVHAQTTERLQKVLGVFHLDFKELRFDFTLKWWENPRKVEFSPGHTSAARKGGRSPVGPQRRVYIWTFLWWLQACRKVGSDSTPHTDAESPGWTKM